MRKHKSESSSAAFPRPRFRPPANLHPVTFFSRTLLLIMREMIQTERDYVASLEYVIENYIPQLLREDIPQALRGQRNVVFGNIEKIYEFHSRHFLQELESCEKNPLSVGQCFLKYVSFALQPHASYCQTVDANLGIPPDRRRRNSTCTRCTTKTNPSRTR